MTIIEPNKSKSKTNFIITFLAGMILVGAILSIFAYSSRVQFGHHLSQKLEMLEELRIENADLKNKLYAILDIQNADELARKMGLIKESKPEYILTSN